MARKPVVVVSHRIHFIETLMGGLSEQLRELKVLIDRDRCSALQDIQDEEAEAGLQQRVDELQVQVAALLTGKSALLADCAGLRAELMEVRSIGERAGAQLAEAQAGKAELEDRLAHFRSRAGSEVQRLKAHISDLSDELTLAQVGAGRGGAGKPPAAAEEPSGGRR